MGDNTYQPLDPLFAPPCVGHDSDNGGNEPPPPPLPYLEHVLPWVALNLCNPTNDLYEQGADCKMQWMVEEEAK